MRPPSEFRGNDRDTQAPRLAERGSVLRGPRRPSAGSGTRKPRARKIERDGAGAPGRPKGKSRGGV